MLALIVAAICVLFACRLTLPLLRLLVDVVAATIGVVLALRARRLERRILATRYNRSVFAGRQTRAERRIMAASLEIALSRTELRSLFPTVADRAERLAMMIKP